MNLSNFFWTAVNVFFTYWTWMIFFYLLCYLFGGVIHLLFIHAVEKVKGKEESDNYKKALFSFTGLILSFWIFPRNVISTIRFIIFKIKP